MGHTKITTITIIINGIKSFSIGHSTSWLFLSTVSRLNWNSKCWFFWREETGEPGEKPGEGDFWSGICQIQKDEINFSEMFA